MSDFPVLDWREHGGIATACDRAWEGGLMATLEIRPDVKRTYDAKAAPVGYSGRCTAVGVIRAERKRALMPQVERPPSGAAAFANPLWFQVQECAELQGDTVTAVVRQALMRCVAVKLGRASGDELRAGRDASGSVAWANESPANAFAVTVTCMSTHPLLADLDADQSDLIKLLGRPWTVGELADGKGWPVWDFVERTFRNGHPTVPAVDVLATLPTLTIGDRSHGLWWRGEAGSHAPLHSGERVGLSIVGLHHLHLLIRHRVPEPVNAIGICLDLIRRATEKERDLDADNDWTKVATGALDLRKSGFGSKDGPVELIGQVLKREFIPIAVSTTNFNYEIPYGGGKLGALRGVRTIGDYIRAAEELASAGSKPVMPSPSPIALPAAMDYLGLVLDQDPRWQITGSTLRLHGLADAALLGRVPSTQAEFDQRMSTLTNILGRLVTPAPLPEAYVVRDWNPAQPGSLNNLDIWLTDTAGIGDGVIQPMETLRSLGTIRQGAQHANSKTIKRRDTALGRFGLAWPISDWPHAWATISDQTASAIYTIAQSVRREEAGGEPQR
jgi:hypothetical protein